MRKLLVGVGLIVAVVGALALFLRYTTPHESAGIRFPLTPSHNALLSAVPASAESFAIIPTAAALDAKLRSNRVTRRAIDQWSETQGLPRPWMLGGADLLVWKSGKKTRYHIRLDPLRATVVRAYMTVRGDLTDTLTIGAMREPPIAEADLRPLLDLAATLPPGDALVVQRKGGRGAFPPIERPSVSTIAITATQISVTARAISREVAGSPITARFPRAAALTAAFSKPPRVLGELNRLTAANVSKLLADGGAIALYEVDTQKLLPRPREVFVLPATDDRREALRAFTEDVAPRAVREAVGFQIETADTGAQLLVAFERETIAKYQSDTFIAQRLPATEWVFRVDPKRVVPMLEAVINNPGLRLLTPRLFRSARDLERWIGDLQQAEAIEASLSQAATVEELRVLIDSK